MKVSKENVLSPDDCRRIIKHYLQSDDFAFIDYQVAPFSNTVDGFMGDHLSIKITIASGGSEKQVSFFAKRFPFNHELQSRYALSVNAFPNEIFTYEVLFNKFKQFEGFDPSIAPKYYSGKDNDLIVFEDLSERGFVLPENSNNLDMNIVKMSLEALSKYHAGSIGYQEKKSRSGKKYRLLDEYPQYMQEPLFRKDENFLGCGWFKARLSALHAVIDLYPFPGISANEFKAKLSEIAESSFGILEPKDEFYNVLCHGDMWGKNVMVRFENDKPVECKLIDFQLQRYCPPAHDVLQFIYLVMGTERRQHHLHELLRFYYDCLKTQVAKGGLNLRTILSYEEFELSVHYLLPQIKLQTAYYYSFQGANPEFHKNVTTNLEDFKKFAFGDGAPFTRDLFKTDPNYRNLMIETLTELKDLITHPRVTLEDCFKVIPCKIFTTDYALLNYSLVPLGKIGGFFGDHYKLKIHIAHENREKTLHLFAKCSPVNKTRFKVAVSCEAFFKERFVLQTLMPMMRDAGIDVINSCTIPCHMLRLNDVTIFDDLDYHGFKTADIRSPFAFDHLKLIVEKLAIYHASNIILEERLSNTEPFRLGDRFPDEVEEFLFSKNAENPSSLGMMVAVETVDHQIDMFPDLHSSIPKEEFKRKAKLAFDATCELVKPSSKFRNVVCHGDLWSSNIMIKHENGKPVDCLIIDYQILRYCPPAHDLLSLLYLTTSRRVRSEHMTELIKLYYRQFASVLSQYGCDPNEIYTYEKFIESCEYMTPQAVCQTVVYYHFTMTDSNLMMEYMSDVQKTQRIFQECRKEFMTDMCGRDPVYRNRIHESLQDLRDVCLTYF